METNRIENEPIKKLLIEFSMPAIIGTLVMAIYNIVDRIFIGNAPNLGSVGIAAVSISYPVVLFMMALSQLSANGGATRFSIALGEKKNKDAKKYQANSFLLSLIIGFFIFIFGNMFIEDILKILGANESIMSYSRDYLSLILYGSVFACISMFGNNFSRAQGNPRNAMISMLIGALFNILFDYIFIMKMGMGMKGAALATIGGQFLSMIWQLVYLFSHRSPLPLRFADMKLSFTHLKNLSVSGVPVFFLQFSNTIMNMFLNSVALANGGNLAVSVIGVIISVQMLVQMPISGITQGQQPIISYNYGAKRKERMKETIKYASLFATAYTVLCMIVIQLFPSQLISIFNQETELIQLGSHALHIWYLGVFLLGAQLIFANFFQAISKIYYATFLNLLRPVILLIPVELICTYFFGLDGVFIAIPIIDILSFVITVVILKREVNKIHFEEV